MNNPANEDINIRVEFHRRTGFKLFVEEEKRFECALSHREMKSTYWAFRLFCQDSIAAFCDYVDANDGVISLSFVLHMHSSSRVVTIICDYVDANDGVIPNIEGVLPLSPPHTVLSEPPQHP